MGKIELVEYVPCPMCGKMGYTDERTLCKGGYLCVRCANPQISFD